MSAEQKHTPGPWKVDHRADDVLTVVPAGSDYPICDLGSVDADDYDADIIAALHADDARLIAAAPAFALAWSMVPGEVLRQIFAALPEWVEKDIAKAEGRAHG